MRRPITLPWVALYKTPAKALIPGVTITLTNTQTGVVDTQSDE